MTAVKFDATRMKPVSREQIKNDYFQVHEFVEYLRILAMDHEGLTLTVGQVASMFELGVRQGMHWDDVADELEIPECDWTSTSSFNDDYRTAD